MNGKWIEIMVAAVALGATATSAVAQEKRDPAYQSARTSGLIGEQTDGYLGFVVPPSASVKALVDDLNIKRKAKFFEIAAQQNVQPKDAAFTAACNIIRATAVGEYYQTPAGEWTKRTAGPPQLDSRCPQ